MFDFLKNIDYLLIRIITEIDNDIKVRNSFTLVAMQSFCEMLVKYINNKELLLKGNKLSLGDFLNHKRFCDILEKDLEIDLLQLTRINNIANDIKHEGKILFDKKEVEKSYKFIYYFAIKVNNYYLDTKIEANYDNQFFENLLTQYDKEKQIIAERIESQEQYKKESIIKADLRDAINQKEILEKRIQQYELEKSNYLERLDKLEKLEVELNKKDVILQELRSNKAKLEQELNEGFEKEKIEYETKIRNLKKETNKLQEEIDELRNEDTIDTIEKIDRDKKILSEKEMEIEKLKSLLEKKEIVENENLYRLYMKTALQMGFSSSYVENDSYFTINGVYSKCTSTSKYKSYYAVLNNILQRGECVYTSDFLESKKLSYNDLKEIFRLEMCLLSLIRNNRLKDNCWNINYINGNCKNLQIAIEDIFYWMELLLSLSKQEYIKPEIKLYNNEYSEKYVNIKYNNKLELDKNIYNICDHIVSDDEDIDDYFNIWVDDYITYKVSKSNKNTLEKLLKLIFKFDCFNNGQYEILEHTLNGNNTIGILPTGGGKSLIYQLASLLEPKICIIVDPLNSLIKDQIYGLKNKFGITRCLNLTSDNQNKKIDEVKLRKSNALFVFTTPERFQNHVFREILFDLASKKSIERIVLDEVHCLSEWGHDFRISYLMLAETLNNYCGNNIKYLGLTATASSNVIRDLISELRMNDEDVVFLKKLRRKNLTFHIKNYDVFDDMKKALPNIIESINPKLDGDNTKALITFCRTKEENSTSIDAVIKYLNPLYDNLIDRYDGDHKTSQDDFMNNEKSILIATKSFGMGIDKPNIRCTIHYGIPTSLENFYQEAGRAGRDGKPADCYLLTYKLDDNIKNEVETFFKANTNVEYLKYIQQYTNRKHDLSTPFYFITKDLETVEITTKKTIDILRNILNNNHNNVAHIYDNEKWGKEIYLYILHTVGILLNWEKNYSNFEYTIYISSHFNNIEHIKNNAKKYISKYSGDGDEVKAIDKIESLSQFDEIIKIVRTWYYNKFTLGKINQLANVYYTIPKFANRYCTEEIQNQIDNYFDLTNTIFKTEDGYSLTFEDDSLTDIIEYISILEKEKITKRCVEMERILESSTTNNINLYTSLLFLRNNQFDSRNGKYRLEAAYKNVDSSGKVEIYEQLSKMFYNILDENQKEQLVNFLYYMDYQMLRSVFLENVKEDSIVRKYWIPYINSKLKEI